jgi:hypothetical protein
VNDRRQYRRLGSDNASLSRDELVDNNGKVEAFRTKVKLSFKYEGHP